jgi:hypothetical protein
MEEILERILSHVRKWLQKQTEESAIFLSVESHSSIKTSTLCAALTYY